MQWKRRLKESVWVSIVAATVKAFVRARSSSLAREKAGRRRKCRRRRKYLRMERPSFTLPQLVYCLMVEHLRLTYACVAQRLKRFHNYDVPSDLGEEGLFWGKAP